MKPEVCPGGRGDVCAGESDRASYSRCNASYSAGRTKLTQFKANARADLGSPPPQSLSSCPDVSLPGMKLEVVTRSKSINDGLGCPADVAGVRPL
jgi:hypothetical protein